MADLKEAVGTVLEGWTLPHDVRKILETAYYADTPAPAQAEQSLEVDAVIEAARAMRNLGVSLNDYDSEMLERLIHFGEGATAALAQKDAEIALLVAERNLAWSMCDQLRARLAEAEKDAGRYRWLRSYNTAKYPTVTEAFFLGDQHLDAAIDAAISSQQEGEK